MADTDTAAGGDTQPRGYTIRRVRVPAASCVCLPVCVCSYGRLVTIWGLAHLFVHYFFFRKFCFWKIKIGFASVSLSLSHCVCVCVLCVCVCL